MESDLLTRDRLKHHFGYADFRPAQRRVIQSVLAGRDALAVLPTGAGKSVCFQIPALVLDGFTIVVSPLISLMQDQVQAAVARGIPAALLNSTLDRAAQQTVLAAVGAVELATGRDVLKRYKPSLWWLGLLVGRGVGLGAGMGGLAGGIVLVPALSILLGLPAGWLAGTSSAVIIFSSLAAAAGYLTGSPAVPPGAGFTGFVALPVVGLLALSAVPAAQFGAWTNRRVRGTVFRRIFAVLMLLVVVRLVLSH